VPLNPELVRRCWQFCGVGHTSNDPATRGLDQRLLDGGWRGYVDAWEPWIRKAAGMWFHSPGGQAFDGNYFQWQQVALAISSKLYKRDDFVGTMLELKLRTRVGIYIGCLRGNPIMERAEAKPQLWWNIAWGAIEPVLAAKPHVIGCDATTVYPIGSLPWCLLHQLRAVAHTWGGIVVGESGYCLDPSLAQPVDGCFTQFGSKEPNDLDGLYGFNAACRGRGKVFAHGGTVDELRLALDRGYEPVAELHVMAG
jgi:hypothetical protein